VPVHCATSAGTLRHQCRYTAPPVPVHCATSAGKILPASHLILVSSEGHVNIAKAFNLNERLSSGLIPGRKISKFLTKLNPYRILLGPDLDLITSWGAIQRRGSILAWIVIFSVYGADTIEIDLSLSSLISRFMK
jgi:hypothetical protein